MLSLKSQLEHGFGKSEYNLFSNNCTDVVDDVLDLYNRSELD